MICFWIEIIGWSREHPTSHPTEEYEDYWERTDNHHKRKDSCLVVFLEDFDLFLSFPGDLLLHRLLASSKLKRLLAQVDSGT